MLSSALFIIIAVAASALRFNPQNAKSGSAGTWYDLFQPPYEQCPTIMIGISCLDSKTCYIPGGQNGQGFDVFLFNGQPNGYFQPLNMPSPMLMCLAIGMGGTPAQPRGAIGGIGLGNGIQYAVNATTFKPSLAPGLFVVTQDIRAAKGGSEVLVIDNANANSVLFSSDGGAILTQKKITSSVPDGAFARYGALISPMVWYVTLGNWPSNVQGRSDRVTLSARLQRDIMTGKLIRHSVLNRQLQKSNGSYSAAIVKTTDGGNTWITQYSDTTLNFYFNAIDCINENVCVAVGEGFDAGAAAHVFRTANAGKTWTQVFQLPSSSSEAYSLMSVGFQSSTVVWAAGSAQQAFSTSALFLVSNDAGVTWTKTSGGVQNIGDVTALSFSPDGSGFATAVTTFDDSTVLAYTTGPAPTPAPGSSFTQMDCQDAACSQGCNNVTFPTNACLQVNGGGSALVKCAPTELLQQFFANSQDCTGTSQNTTMPLNKCIQSSQGGYFENFCQSQVRRNIATRR